MRKEKGFTLVELLIVIAILGVLAAVVIPNVIGLLGRGGQQAFETDEEVIQLAAATFFADVRAGYNATDDTWSDSDMGNTSGHYYPTKLGNVAEHVLVLNLDVTDNGNPRIDVSISPATDVQIQDHAIWMGLLVNGDGQFTAGSGGSSKRGAVSPLTNEDGPYLNEMPNSAMASDTYNGAPAPGGGYCWVVGRNGVVFGAYPVAENEWYAGFSGAYP